MTLNEDMVLYAFGTAGFLILIFAVLSTVQGSAMESYIVCEKECSDTMTVFCVQRFGEPEMWCGNFEEMCKDVATT